MEEIELDVKYSLHPIDNTLSLTQNLIVIPFSPKISLIPNPILAGDDVQFCHEAWTAIGRRSVQDVQSAYFLVSVG